MPSQIGILVNGWAVSLNRTPNVTVLQTYTPAADHSDTGDFVAEFRSRENRRSTKSMKTWFYSETREELKLPREELRLQELRE
jgi:hypothetical protein